MYSPQEFLRIAYEDSDGEHSYLFKESTPESVSKLHAELENVPIPEDIFYLLFRECHSWLWYELEDRVVASGNPHTTFQLIDDVWYEITFELAVKMFCRFHPDSKDHTMPFAGGRERYLKIKHFISLGFRLTFIEAECDEDVIKLYFEGIYPLNLIIRGIEELESVYVLYGYHQSDFTALFRAEWNGKDRELVFSAVLRKMCIAFYGPPLLQTAPHLFMTIEDRTKKIEFGIREWLRYPGSDPNALASVLGSTPIPRDLLFELITKVELELSAVRRKELSRFYSESQKNIRHEVLLVNMSTAGFYPEELAELVPMNDYEVLRQAIIDHNPVYNEFKKYVKPADGCALLNFALKYL
jgi:hypothetical protein